MFYFERATESHGAVLFKPVVMVSETLMHVLPLMLYVCIHKLSSVANAGFKHIHTNFHDRKKRNVPCYLVTTHIGYLLLLRTKRTE